MANVFEWIYVVFAVLLLFGAAIAVHEWGHYWVALKRGLKVEAFAIGFGPKIWGWTKDGIEYSIRWIPAGGYVKLPQMITSEAIEGEQKGEPLPPVSPWSKILVAFAGPFMNLVFAFGIATLIYFVGLPIKVNPSIIGHVAPGSEEAKLGIQAGDRIISIDGKLARSWEDVYQTVALARTNVLPVVLARTNAAGASAPAGEERKTYHLTAPVKEGVGLKVLNLEPRDHPVIKGLVAGGAAEAAGLKPGDEIIEFNHLPIAGRDQFIAEVQKRGGMATDILVKRGTERVKLAVTPRGDPTAKVARIGVEVGSSTVEIYQLQKPGPLPWVLLGEVCDQVVSTFSALAHSKQTGIGAKDLSGPVGIFAVLAAQVKQDYRLALKFMILLNISLAVMNLLPIPVLDGGHIVMAIFEKLRGKPLSVKIQEYATTAFAVLLLSFMVYVTFYDIKRISIFRSMFSQEVQIEAAPQAPAAEPAPAKQ
ncbi:MAG: RIP metalloprotease RseP [Pedosphaera sp. Tous-C6FEB]|nr:MAG: RIP metalloprotease RseP [Pedosphaera sp. Tous-C6FEB]